MKILSITPHLMIAECSYCGWSALFLDLTTLISGKDLTTLVSGKNPPVLNVLTQHINNCRDPYFQFSPDQVFCDITPLHQRASTHKMSGKVSKKSTQPKDRET